MNLHVDSYGSGAPLLFIHGWGMHGGMWGGVLAQLAEHFQVMAVDLPGPGYSVGRDFSRLGGDVGINPDLHDLVDQLAEQFTGPLTVCGWSLGGQVALRWAVRYPQQVDRLVLVSSTPCFVQQTDWPCALAADTLAAFAAALQQDYLPTLRRFLALQVRGSEQERELLVTLRHSLLSRGEPDMAALQSGLEILRASDLRTSLPEVRQRTLVIAGERDTLTPLSASRYLAAQMPNARLVAIRGAAHPPFLSHPDIFVEQLVSFLHE
ncbi:MAG: pimeloyl-ACP methyl ester esterase BioH [Gallionella sp.]|nr:pimeloyl-ACP methyl ester esterase BioH [Gallionella sp.]